MVEENGGSETAAGHVRSYFGGGKGAVAEIWQLWRGKGRDIGSRFREQSVLVGWDGYRGRLGWQMKLFLVTRQTITIREKVQEWVSLPGGHWAAKGKEWRD